MASRKRKSTRVKPGTPAKGKRTKAEAAKTEAVKTEAAKTKAAKTKAAKTKAAKTKAAKTEPKASARSSRISNDTHEHSSSKAARAVPPHEDASQELSPDDKGDSDDSPEVLVGELVDEEELDFSDDALDDVVGRTRQRQSKRQSKEDVHFQLIKRDPLSAYVQETKRFPLLSREEEHELALQFHEQGDTNAARRLIEANLRLVVKIAYEYRRAHKNLLDLIQEGNMGLMQAVKKYDPYRGVKLSSYAAWWIRAYILKFVLANWRLVKIGTTQAQRKLFFNLRKEQDRLEQLGFQPTPALLAANLEVAEKDIVEMQKRMAAPDASLDAPLTTDDEGMAKTGMDFLAGADEMRPDLQVARGELQDLLRAKLDEFADTLEGREEAIFRSRLVAESPATLQEIGDRFAISRERARQLEKRLLGKLRAFLEYELGTAIDIEAMIRE